MYTVHKNTHLKKKNRIKISIKLFVYIVQFKFKLFRVTRV